MKTSIKTIALGLAIALTSCASNTTTETPVVTVDSTLVQVDTACCAETPTPAAVDTTTVK